MKIFKSPFIFKHEFEKGYGYEGKTWIDDGWERITLVAYDQNGNYIAEEETKWVKQKSLFAEYRHFKGLKKAEKNIHRALELHYKKNIFYCSVL